MNKVGLFFGGIGNEADISVKSAKNVVANFDFKKNALILIYWHKNGRFYKIKNIGEIKNVNKKNEIKIEDFSKYFGIALPMTHGKYGEDGGLQGILECQKIKYCGCHILSSALCMDKAVFKTFIQAHGIDTPKFRILDARFLNRREIIREANKIKKELKLPVFVKPSNSGSSIGITKVKNYSQFNSAINKALKHDKKIIIEEGLNNVKEIEVAVLGNEDLIISNPGELKPANEFYDFNDKYKLNKTVLEIPARIRTAQTNKIKKIAEKAHRLCDCKGFARIDFFILGNRIYLNEINTLPGFTKNSMYTLLMMNSGLSYNELIAKIIELAY